MKSRRRPRRAQRSSPFLGTPIPSLGTHRYSLTLNPSAFPYLRDHRLHGKLVLPGAVYIEMAVAMATALGHGAVCLTSIEFQRAAFLKGDRPHVLQAVLDPEPEGPTIFRVFSATADIARSTPHVSMHVQACPDDEEEQVNLAELRHRCPTALTAALFYDELRNGGNDYGPAFQGITQVWRGPREAIAWVEIPMVQSQDADDLHVHPILLDSCMQLVLAAQDTRHPSGSLLLGVESIRFFRSPGARCWAHARLHPADGPAGDTVADVRLLSEAGEILMDLSGVRFRALSAARSTAQQAESQLTVAVSATFTADPLEDSFAFWTRELKIPANLILAPYNQPFQQLLDPHSILATNRNGLNVMLVRVEDWIWRDHRDSASAARSLLNPPPAAGTPYVLPNGLEIAHLNQYETDYLYKEIFRDEAYLRHGVVLGDGDCVIDVGANIGLFTLFVLGKCRDPRLYAFEPSPTAFDVLARNVAPHGDNVKVFNIGLSDRDGELPFTVYRKSTLFSGYYAREDQDRRAMAAVVRNVLRNGSDASADTVHRFAEELVNTRMDSETITSRVRTLASIIDEERLDRIDLLKIDAEKSELAILRGLGDAGWRMIRQIVVEVHDVDGEVGQQVQHMLEAHGFIVASDQEPLLRDSSLSTLYAIRPTTALSPVDGAAASVEGDSLERNARDFIGAMTIAATRPSSPYLVCLCPPSSSVLHNPARRGRVEATEAFLTKQLTSIGAVQVVKAEDIFGMYPIPDYEDPQADKLGHIPYTSSFYAAVSTIIARRLHVLWRKPYKVIVLDGDETLWQGRCGEDPPEALKIDARRGLQEFMCRQHDAGMLLALCSKNNEDDVLAVFTSHPDMPLTLEHFVARRINWKRKSENVSDLAAELGLGLDSFIFVDDDPMECAEMSARWPEVLTLPLPSESDKIPHYLDHVWAFDHARLTEEDVERPTFYRQERRRLELRRASLTFADFLASLEVRVRIATAGQADVPRIAELTMRTNQFNVTTIRRSENEIREWLQSRDVECLVVDVSDRFGDYGLVGTILLTIGADALNVDTFLLSCRALGRGVEHHMLAWLGKRAIECGLDRIDIPFVPTGRNYPALAFLQEVGSKFVDSPTSGDERATRLFKFPARFAASMVYQPTAATLEPTAQDAELKGAPAAQDSDRRTPASVFHHIATELDDVGRILAASRRRERAGIAAADGLPAFDDEVTRTVAAVWRDVLGVETVGVSDNFFQMGATSLDVALVAAELERRMDLDIPLVSFLDKTTVGSMARLLKNQGETELTEDLATSRLRGEQRRAHAIGGLGRR